MAAVMIGVDPHKASHTAVAISAAEELLGEVRVRASVTQVERLLAWAVAWPERTWAIEGADGTGHLLAQQLLAAGERVLDVQPKLSARVRLLAAGATGKNDPNDARSVAVAALRSPAARAVAADDHAAVLRVWPQAAPGPGPAADPAGVPAARGAAGCCRAASARRSPRAWPRSCWPRSRRAARSPRPATSSRPQFVADLRGIDAQMRDTKNKLAVAVRAAGTSLTGLFGVGPVIAAIVIGDVREVSRFPGPDHFAAWNGTAPAGVSSGQRKTCRLSRRGNRRVNHAIHMAAVTQALPAQPGPRLLRQEKGRRQDRQRSAPRAETADQRRHLRPAAGRRATRRRQRERPGRATGERLWLQRGRLTPRTPALRTSHSRACHPAYDPRQRTARSCPAFPPGCHLARAGKRVQDRAQPGRAAAPAGRP